MKVVHFRPHFYIAQRSCLLDPREMNTVKLAISNIKGSKPHLRGFSYFFMYFPVHLIENSYTIFLRGVSKMSEMYFSINFYFLSRWEINLLYKDILALIYTPSQWKESLVEFKSLCKGPIFESHLVLRGIYRLAKNTPL